MNLGYFADYTNEAQNAEVIETLNSISSETGAGERAARNGHGPHRGGERRLDPLPVRTVVRRLGDPVFSATNNMVIAFIFFFSSIYLGLTVLMIPGRLRVTGQFRRAVFAGASVHDGKAHPLCLLLHDGNQRGHLPPHDVRAASALTGTSSFLSRASS